MFRVDEVSQRRIVMGNNVCGTHHPISRGVTISQQNHIETLGQRSARSSVSAVFSLHPGTPACLALEITAASADNTACS